MQSISPEIVFRGNGAWEKAIPQFTKLIQSPLILGRSIHTQNLRVRANGKNREITKKEVN